MRVQIGLSRVVISVIAVKILLFGKIWLGTETHSFELLPNCYSSKIKVRVDGVFRCRVTAVAIARIIASYRQRQGNGFRCPSQCRSGKIIASDIACRAIVQAHKPAIAVMFVIAADQTEGQFINVQGEVDDALETTLVIIAKIFLQTAFDRKSKRTR